MGGGIWQRPNTTTIYVDTAQHTHPETEVIGLVDDLASKVDVADVGVADGVASLDSDGYIPLEQIPASIVSGMKWMGTWDASTNTPTLTVSPASSTTGYFYKVSVAGTQSITGSSVAFAIGDWVISNGTDWQRVASTEAVSSVNAKTGAVVLTASDVGAPALSAVLAKGDLLVGTASGTMARQAIGTDGYVPVADSSATTGITWKAYSSSTSTTLSRIYVYKTSGTTFAGGTDIIYNTIGSSAGSKITYSTSTGYFVVSPGTYRLEAGCRQTSSSSASDYGFVDSSNVAITGMSLGSANSIATQGDGLAMGVITFTATTTFKVRNTAGTGSAGAGQTWAIVEEVPTETSIPASSTAVTEWASYTPTITALTTSPTLATTKTLLARYKVVGKSLHIAFTYYAASSTGAAVGSGAYQFSLPSGYTINTTVAPIVSSPTSVSGDFCGATASTLGTGVAQRSGYSGSCAVVGLSTTTVGLYLINSSQESGTNYGASCLIGSGNFGVVGANCLYKFTAEIPIV